MTQAASVRGTDSVLGGTGDAGCERWGASVSLGAGVPFTPWSIVDGGTATLVRVVIKDPSNNDVTHALECRIALLVDPAE